MNAIRPAHRASTRRQFRVALCGHKAVEAGAACLILMVQGHVADLTVWHFAIATKTGLLAVSPALLVSFSRYARHFVNRWTSSAFFAVCTFFADAVSHPSHYPGEYSEALLTAAGAFAFSIAVAYTPVGDRIERLAEAFIDGDERSPEAPTIAGTF